MHAPGRGREWRWRTLLVIGVALSAALTTAQAAVIPAPANLVVSINAPATLPGSGTVPVTVLVKNTGAGKGNNVTNVVVTLMAVAADGTGSVMTSPKPATINPASAKSFQFKWSPQGLQSYTLRAIVEGVRNGLDAGPVEATLDRIVIYGPLGPAQLKAVGGQGNPSAIQPIACAPNEYVRELTSDTGVCGGLPSELTLATLRIDDRVRFGEASGEAIVSQRVPWVPGFAGLDFYTNDANRMSITNGGNVGIGTTSPAAKLAVSGSSHADSYNLPDGQEDLRVLSSDNRPRDGGVVTLGGAWGPTGYIKTAAIDGKGGDLILGNRRGPTATTMEPGIVLTMAGNVGIGTTSPGQKFVVEGGVSVFNGGVGIGTTPTASLDVNGSVKLHEDGGDPLPACDASKRGQLNLTWAGHWYSSDRLQICMMHADGTFGWITVAAG
jgi:hypothetical protein